jgi:hypothetical protein
MHIATVGTPRERACYERHSRAAAGRPRRPLCNRARARARWYGHTVFLARDLRHGRPVALKVLHPELGAALGGERFQCEIRLAARLQHPHILTVHDSGALDILERLLKVPYYVSPAFLRIDPEWKPLHDDPRFQRLVQSG